MNEIINYKTADSNRGAGTTASNEWMQSAIDKAPLCICRYLPDTTLTFVNETMCTLFELPKNKIIGKRWIDWVPGQEKEEVQKMLNSLYDELKPALIQYRLLCSDGELKYTEWSHSPIFNEENQAVEFQGFGIDITDKKELEKTLLCERELFAGGPVTVFKWKVSAETITEYVSQNVKTTLGYDPEEFLNNSVDFKQLIHPDDFQRVYDESRAALKAGIFVCELQYRIKTKNGAYRWFFDFTRVITNDQGTVTAAHSYLFDNTTKKEAEDALRAEQELFVGGPVTVFKWLATPETPTAYVSTNVRTTLGYEVEEFLSGAVNFRLLIHPDDWKRISDEVENNIKAGILFYQQQYRIKNKKGVYRWHTDFTRVITNDLGEITHYHAYIYDNTAQKNAEEALLSERELFIGGPVVTISWKPDASAGVKYVSPNIFLLLGYKPEELLEEKFNYLSIIHPDDLSMVKQEMKHFRETLKDQYEQEYRIKRKDGIYIWVHDFTITQRNKENEVFELHGYLIDVTSRKNTEEVLLKSEHELRRTNMMKDKFFSIISHDLRSPFQGLLGMANILVEDDGLTNEERHEFTLKLYEALKSQFNFIDDLLTWNRIQRGAIEFNPAMNDIIILVINTISLLKNSIENKNLKLTCNMPEYILAKFDKYMVATILRNLISNAVKFSHKNGDLKISVADHLDKIEVCIQDTGIGINECDLEKLWDSDILFTTKGTEGENGTGLGLVLCKDFVEKHDGAISVQSQVDKGSVFCFTIPKKRKSFI